MAIGQAQGSLGMRMQSEERPTRPWHRWSIAARHFGEPDDIFQDIWSGFRARADGRLCILWLRLLLLGFVANDKGDAMSVSLLAPAGQ